VLRPFLGQLPFAQAQCAFHAIGHLAPEARVARRRAIEVAAAQPTHQPLSSQRVQRGMQQHTRAAAGQQPGRQLPCGSPDQRAGAAAHRPGDHRAHRAPKEVLHNDQPVVPCASR
jgi:hypothetical protein